jgi:hypothetical protein
MSEVQVRELRAESIGASLGELRCGYEGHATREDTLRLSFLLENDPDPVATAVLAQAMLAVPDDFDLVVDLHDRPETLRWLLRGGVVSALSRRRCVRFEGLPETLGQGRLWNTWTPGAHAVMAPMFGQGAEAEAPLFGPGHAVFINPHLTTEPYAQASLTPLVRRWLTQVVAPGLSAAEQEAFIAAPIFAIDQLVHNVREHAIGASAHHHVDSVVGLEVAGAGLERRLRVSVIDTGPGVESTLRPKLAGAPEYPGEDDLLAALLDGALPGWHRGRGFGLATIAGLVNDSPGATLELWSGAARVAVDTHVAKLPAPGVAGTVVNAFFPLPLS